MHDCGRRIDHLHITGRWETAQHAIILHEQYAVAAFRPDPSHTAECGEGRDASSLDFFTP